MPRCLEDRPSALCDVFLALVIDTSAFFWMHALSWIDVNDAHGVLQSPYLLWRELALKLKLIWMFHKQRRNFLGRRLRLRK